MVDATSFLPALLVNVPSIRHRVGLVIVEEAPGTTMKEHVIRQSLADCWSVTLIATFCIWTMILSILAQFTTVAQDHVFRELRDEGMTQIFLFATEHAFMILYSLQGGGIFLGASTVSLFHVALLRGIVDKGNGIRLFKIPNAGVSAERKHLVRQCSPQERCGGILTSTGRLGDIALITGQLEAAMVSHNVV